MYLLVCSWGQGNFIVYVNWQVRCA